MESDTLLGVLIVLASGMMIGSYTLPLKYAPRWNWENTWGAGSLLALLLVPWPLAFLTVPHLSEAYQAVSWKSLLTVLLFGCGWGVGGIFFGLGVAALGLSVGLSLIMGLNAIVGSIIPLAMEHPEQLGRPAGNLLLAGVGVMLVGVAVCGAAGQMKEPTLPTSEVSERGKGKYSFKVGLLLCVSSAVLSALLNFGLIYGADVREAALRGGAQPSSANNAIWALMFSANYVVNTGYAAYLMWRHRSLAKYWATRTSVYWLGALFLGIVWAGGIVVYGVGTTTLGPFGPFLGFPIMLISSVLTGNALGTLSGEWTGVGPRPRRVMGLGVLLLLVAIFALGYSNHLISSSRLGRSPRKMSSFSTSACTPSSTVADEDSVRLVGHETPALRYCSH